MPTPTALLDSVPAEPADAQRARERALSVSLRWISLALPPLWAVLLAEVLWDAMPASLVLWLVVITSPVPLLYGLRKRLGYRVTSIAAQLIVLGASLYIEVVRGFTPGAALLANTLLMLSMLYFGDRAFRWALLACLANLALGWYLHSTYFAGLGVGFSDPGRPLVWVRHGLLLAFFAGAVRDISRDVRSLESEQLLNDLGGVLASSLDAEKTLKEVGQRVVRHFADWCFIELKQDGTRCLSVAAREPDSIWLAEALRDLPLDYQGPRFAAEVWRTHEPVIARVTDEYLRGHSQSPVHLALLKAIGARSLAGVPIITNHSMTGILIAVSTRVGYDDEDLHVLQQIAARAGMAMENAVLHAALQRAHQEIQANLAELQEAQRSIRTLTGILPVCAWCGKIRDDHGGGLWKRFDRYVLEYNAADLSHGICPDCAEQYLPPCPSEGSPT